MVNRIKNLQKRGEYNRKKVKVILNKKVNKIHWKNITMMMMKRVQLK